MKKCKYEGHEYFPQYGVGPHRHDLSTNGSFLNSTVPLRKEDWPKNYSEDPEVPGCGIYVCPECFNTNTEVEETP